MPVFTGIGEKFTAIGRVWAACRSFFRFRMSFFYITFAGLKVNTMNKKILLFATGLTLVTALRGQDMKQMWGDGQTIKKVTASVGTQAHLFDWGNYAMFAHWGLFSHLANQWEGKPIICCHPIGWMEFKRLGQHK